MSKMNPVACQRKTVVRPERAHCHRLRNRPFLHQKRPGPQSRPECPLDPEQSVPNRESALPECTRFVIFHAISLFILHRPAAGTTGLCEVAVIPSPGTAWDSLIGTPTNERSGRGWFRQYRQVTELVLVRKPHKRLIYLNNYPFFCGEDFANIVQSEGKTP